MADISKTIEAKILAAGYGNFIVWRNASFSLGKGEFVGVLGPNGAGKTTLFRLLLGLDKPQMGELLLFGEVPRRGNIRIGYVPQRHPIDPETKLEVLELVRLGLAGNRYGFSTKGKSDRLLASEALKLVGAEALTHKPLGVLSGGEAQRVFMAEALVGKPDILLLDEPLANLDIRGEQELVKIIADVVKTRGVTVLLIAHNINPLLPALNRVIYIANGHVATGTPAEVLTSASLSALYGTPIEVFHGAGGRVAVLGIEEAPHHEHNHHHE